MLLRILQGVWGIFFIFSSILFAQISELEPAETCQECHPKIFDEWNGSAHASSASGKEPLYDAMLQWASRDTGGKLENACRSCHEPVRLHPSTGSPKSSLYREGVTCDICHAVYPNKNGALAPINPTNKGMKLGPSVDAISSYHESKFWPDLQKSLQCLQCHSELVSPKSNLEICITGLEWAKSPYKKYGIECQDCHMVSQAGRSANLGKIRDNIHNHSIPGNSIEFLRVALKLNLDIDVNNDSLVIKTKILNHGAGHQVPTGTPLRSIVLTLKAFNDQDETVWRNWRNDPVKENPEAVFARFLVDARGNGPVPPWQAEKVLFDNRIPANKEVILVYQIPRKQIVAIEATLDYHVAPTGFLRKFSITDEKFTQPRQMAAIMKQVAN